MVASLTIFVKFLPAEAEWGFTARNASTSKVYSSGDNLTPESRRVVNTVRRSIQNSGFRSSAHAG